MWCRNNKRSQNVRNKTPSKPLCHFKVKSLSVTVLVSVVLEDSNEGLLECTRVYGNLSRYPTVRRILAEKKGELEVFA